MIIPKCLYGSQSRTREDWDRIVSIACTNGWELALSDVEFTAAEKIDEMILLKDVNSSADSSQEVWRLHWIPVSLCNAVYLEQDLEEFQRFFRLCSSGMDQYPWFTAAMLCPGNDITSAYQSGMKYAREYLLKMLIAYIKWIPVLAANENRFCTSICDTMETFSEFDSCGGLQYATLWAGLVYLIACYYDYTDDWMTQFHVLLRKKYHLNILAALQTEGVVRPVADGHYCLTKT